MEDDLICPDCDARFYVVWSRQYEGQKPEYCPMCGGEIDYREAWQKAHPDEPK